MHDNNNANDQKRLEILLKKNMEQISNKILVLSNKGGVGKSSIAVNLAFSLSQKKLKVGLLDADIHGPSIAKLLGFEGKKLAFENNTIIPYQVNENLVAISIASLLETVDTPVVRSFCSITRITCANAACLNGHRTMQKPWPCAGCQAGIRRSIRARRICRAYLTRNAG